MDKQYGIRNCFEVGQEVLVREGTRWVTRTIERITVWRGSDDRGSRCPHCGLSLLGEPRFWFRDWGNIPITEIMAKEDIDPVADRVAASAQEPVRPVAVAAQEVEVDVEQQRSTTALHALAIIEEAGWKLAPGPHFDWVSSTEVIVNQTFRVKFTEDEELKYFSAGE